MDSVKNVSKIHCHDCRKELKEGLALVYEENGEKMNPSASCQRQYKIHKCPTCYEKNPSLKNYKKCEVYSRIVGYIRPVQQWHKGKQQEFAERLEFKCGC